MHEHMQGYRQRPGQLRDRNRDWGSNRDRDRDWGMNRDRDRD